MSTFHQGLMVLSVLALFWEIVQLLEFHALLTKFGAIRGYAVWWWPSMALCLAIQTAFLISIT